MRRSDVLQKAENLINGDRAADYGDARENFSRIAHGWNIIVSEAMSKQGYLTEAHVALMMDWLKTARLLNSINHADSWVDKAAYSALGAELANAKD